MAAIITEKFRQINAAQFEESFSETNENYYMFVGKSTPFTSGTSGGSDTSPPTPVDDITSENYRWDSMLGANAIAASDVSRGLHNAKILRYLEILSPLWLNPQNPKQMNPKSKIKNDRINK